MKYLVFCSTFLVLYHIAAVSTTDTAGPQTIEYDLKKEIEVRCDVKDNKNANITWKRDDKLVNEIPGLKERVKIEKFSLKISVARPDDGGNYSCQFSDDQGKVNEQTIKVIRRLHVRVPNNVNVVEGTQLKIKCEVAGGQKADITWEYKPENNDTRRPLTEDDERVEIENDGDILENAILMVKNISLDDRGYYICTANHEGERVEAMTMVRVKDQYAALWPFLGIVAEVVILCVIIFIYEKKHNKAELEESDTDQSPDQKNTADQGKGSSLRHRQ